jgi:hypothetical protein
VGVSVVRVASKLLNFAKKCARFAKKSHFIILLFVFAIFTSSFNQIEAQENELLQSSESIARKKHARDPSEILFYPQSHEDMRTYVKNNHQTYGPDSPLRINHSHDWTRLKETFKLDNISTIINRLGFVNFAYYTGKTEKLGNGSNQRPKAKILFSPKNHEDMRTYVKNNHQTYGPDSPFRISSSNDWTILKEKFNLENISTIKKQLGFVNFAYYTGETDEPGKGKNQRKKSEIRFRPQNHNEMIAYVKKNNEEYSLDSPFRINNSHDWNRLKEQFGLEEISSVIDRLGFVNFRFYAGKIDFTNLPAEQQLRIKIEEKKSETNEKKQYKNYAEFKKAYDKHNKLALEPGSDIRSLESQQNYADFAELYGFPTLQEAQKILIKSHKSWFLDLQGKRLPKNNATQEVAIPPEKESENNKNNGKINHSFPGVDKNGSISAKLEVVENKTDIQKFIPDKKNILEFEKLKVNIKNYNAAAKISGWPLLNGEGDYLLNVKIGSIPHRKYNLPWHPEAQNIVRKAGCEMKDLFPPTKETRTTLKKKRLQDEGFDEKDYVYHRPKDKPTVIFFNPFLPKSMIDAMNTEHGTGLTNRIYVSIVNGASDLMIWAENQFSKIRNWKIGFNIKKPKGSFKKSHSDSKNISEDNKEVDEPRSVNKKTPGKPTFFLTTINPSSVDKKNPDSRFNGLIQDYPQLVDKFVDYYRESSTSGYTTPRMLMDADRVRKEYLAAEDFLVKKGFPRFDNVPDFLVPAGKTWESLVYESRCKYLIEMVARHNQRMNLPGLEYHMIDHPNDLRNYGEIYGFENFDANWDILQKTGLTWADVFPNFRKIKNYQQLIDAILIHNTDPTKPEIRLDLHFISRDLNSHGLKYGLVDGKAMFDILELAHRTQKDLSQDLKNNSAFQEESRKPAMNKLPKNIQGGTLIGFGPAQWLSKWMNQDHGLSLTERFLVWAGLSNPSNGHAPHDKKAQLEMDLKNFAVLQDKLSTYNRKVKSGELSSAPIIVHDDYYRIFGFDESLQLNDLLERLGKNWYDFYISDVTEHNANELLAQVYDRFKSILLARDHTKSHVSFRYQFPDVVSLSDFFTNSDIIATIPRIGIFMKVLQAAGVTEHDFMNRLNQDLEKTRLQRTPHKSLTFKRMQNAITENNRLSRNPKEKRIFLSRHNYSLAWKYTIPGSFERFPSKSELVDKLGVNAFRSLFIRNANRSLTSGPRFNTRFYQNPGGEVGGGGPNAYENYKNELLRLVMKKDFTHFCKQLDKGKFFESQIQKDFHFKAQLIDQIVKIGFSGFANELRKRSALFAVSDHYLLKMIATRSMFHQNYYVLEGYLMLPGIDANVSDNGHHSIFINAVLFGDDRVVYLLSRHPSTIFNKFYGARGNKYTALGAVFLSPNIRREEFRFIMDHAEEFQENLYPNETSQWEEIFKKNNQNREQNSVITEIFSERLGMKHLNPEDVFQGEILNKFNQKPELVVKRIFLVDGNHLRIASGLPRSDATKGSFFLIMLPKPKEGPENPTLRHQNLPIVDRKWIEVFENFQSKFAEYNSINAEKDRIKDLTGLWKNRKRFGFSENDIAYIQEVVTNSGGSYATLFGRVETPNPSFTSSHAKEIQQLIQDAGQISSDINTIPRADIQDDLFSEKNLGVSVQDEMEEKEKKSEFHKKYVVLMNALDLLNQFASKDVTKTMPLILSAEDYLMKISHYNLIYKKSRPEIMKIFTNTLNEYWTSFPKLEEVNNILAETSKGWKDLIASNPQYVPRKNNGDVAFRKNVEGVRTIGDILNRGMPQSDNGSEFLAHDGESSLGRKSSALFGSHQNSMGGFKPDAITQLRQIVSKLSTLDTDEAKENYFKTQKEKLIGLQKQLLKEPTLRKEVVGLLGNASRMSRIGREFKQNVVFDFSKFFVAGTLSHMILAATDPSVSEDGMIDLIREFKTNTTFAVGSALGTTLFDILTPLMSQKLAQKYQEELMKGMLIPGRKMNLSQVLGRETSLWKGFARNQIGMLAGTIVNLALNAPKEMTAEQFWTQVVETQVSFVLAQGITRGSIRAASMLLNDTLKTIKVSSRGNWIVSTLLFTIDLTVQSQIMNWLAPVVSQAQLSSRIQKGIQTWLAHPTDQDMQYILQNMQAYWEIILEMPTHKVTQKYEKLQNKLDEELGGEFIVLWGGGKVHPTTSAVPQQEMNELWRNYMVEFGKIQHEQQNLLDKYFAQTIKKLDGSIDQAQYQLSLCNETNLDFCVQAFLALSSDATKFKQDLMNLGTDVEIFKSNHAGLGKLGLNEWTNLLLGMARKANNSQRETLLSMMRMHTSGEKNSYMTPDTYEAVEKQSDVINGFRPSQVKKYADAIARKQSFTLLTNETDSESIIEQKARDKLIEVAYFFKCEANLGEWKDAYLEKRSEMIKKPWFQKQKKNVYERMQRDVTGEWSIMANRFQNHVSTQHTQLRGLMNVVQKKMNEDGKKIKRLGSAYTEDVYTVPLAQSMLSKYQQSMTCF